MATYVDFYSEVLGTVPALNKFLAQRFVNRAWTEIRASRWWSFLRGEGSLWSPAAVSSGICSVTQGSATVTADATATTALTGLSQPLITLRQIRFGGGPLYNIAGFSGSTIILDRLYREATNASITYACYRAYYGAPEDGTGTPVTDFLRYVGITDAVLPATMMLNYTREEFDNWDPQRASTTNPLYLGTYKADANGSPWYELYPHPLVARGYFCIYQKRGIDFAADTDVLPTAVPDNLLISRALYYACTWAMGNAGRYPELKGINWPTLRAEYQATFADELFKARKQDQETMIQNVITSDVGSYQNSAAWRQSHAVAAR